MFKRFTDDMSNAANAAASGMRGLLSGEEEKVRRLRGMGFDSAEARRAIRATDGDVDRAAELLLASEGDPQQRRWQQGTAVVSPPAPARGADADVQMQRAMEESRRAEEDRMVREAKEASAAGKGKAKSKKAARERSPTTAAGRAAARRAEEAAQGKFGAGKGVKKKSAVAETTATQAPPAAFPPPPSRGGIRMKSNGITAHHPDVKVPVQMKDKKKEEQILRCADRVAPHPAAVDTLLRALTAVRDDPGNDRYRKVDKTTAGYVRTLKDKPGAEDMLLAMSFKRRGNTELVLERSMVDPALLYLGISALEKARATDEYRDGKRKAVFAKEVREMQDLGNSSEAEAIRRAEFMAKCPSEPQGGQGALVQLAFADETVRRRFDGDDVLGDIMNWIGGHGSAIPDKINSREWCLVDLNRYPGVPIDTEKNIDKTLQFIGCWPSGRLEVRPSTDDWKVEKGTGGVVMGSSRGLGSAPTSELH